MPQDDPDDDNLEVESGAYELDRTQEIGFLAYPLAIGSAVKIDGTLQRIDSVRLVVTSTSGAERAYRLEQVGQAWRFPKSPYVP